MQFLLMVLCLIILLSVKNMFRHNMLAYQYDLYEGSKKFIQKLYFQIKKKLGLVSACKIAVYGDRRLENLSKDFKEASKISYLLVASCFYWLGNLLLSYIWTLHIRKSNYSTSSFLIAQFFTFPAQQICLEISVIFFTVFCFYSKWYYKYAIRTKIITGMSISFLAFVISLITRNFSNVLSDYSYQWLLFPQYFLIVASEVLVAGPSLELAYTHSPPSMRFALSAFYNLVSSLDKSRFYKIEDFFVKQNEILVNFLGASSCG